ncbi:TetR/AcrR family transcriptional regulator [Pseudomaricurvus alkylphenolicus]|uniref:TetR/AcrR family transcriptional regulator n=1 Tax=Pseudomaricurvus alkylphenolicus TaxID=1306991 RepID=UPI001422A785|nr:TetR/AcrR family transcriptional regulator [Pseudomaricurvus alkylphenolicus]NIB44077.1 TetR/AcrR family transcriptional regulator [Pseudomaricurvus alkylphenolicus]
MTQRINSETMATSLVEEGEDFRSQVAKNKRERMKKRLLFAALDVFWTKDLTNPPVIDDVVRAAGVSRGTFYKYFDSLETVLCELGKLMADDMIGTYERVFSRLQVPIARVAAGPLLSLTHAAMQPRRVAFTSRVDYVDYLSRENRLWQVVNASLENARDSGSLYFSSLEVATDLVIGTTLEGLRRVMHSDRFDQGYIEELVARILLGCGASLPDSEKAVAGAWRELAHHAESLNWWRPKFL